MDIERAGWDTVRPPNSVPSWAKTSKFEIRRIFLKGIDDVLCVIK